MSRFRTRAGHRTGLGARTLQGVLALLCAFALVFPTPSTSGLVPPESALAAPKPAGAVASGFLTFKFVLGPTGVCTGTGLNVSNAPYFKTGQCGFVSFTITGAGTGADVDVEFVGEDGSVFNTQQAQLDPINGDWEFDITPAAGWPAGMAEARVKVDGEHAGSTNFGFQVLGANLSLGSAGAPYRTGEPLPITGNIAQLDSLSNLGPVVRTGVPASFTLAVITPAGAVRPVPGGPISAAANGSFSATVPGSLTSDLSAVGDELQLSIAVAALNATYTDATTGTWAAKEAGRLPVTLLAAPNRLTLRASFVSATGWVEPGDTFPMRIFVSNPTDTAATGVTATLTAPPSLTFQTATPLVGGGSASVSAGSVTWTIGNLPAATAAGPMVRTLVVTARAATLAEDAEIVWKDLSTTASLTYTGYAGSSITSSTHGPKVIPPEGGFETARYGDKPFPIVPVEYVDLERQSNETFDNDSEKLSTVVNDPGFTGSTFNLYQEMSYGQLFPQGSVPSAGIASATFSGYGPGFSFTTPDRTDPDNAACRGATTAETPGVIGSPAFDTRIQDGWYQLPGTTEYYGGDFPVFTSLTIAIDSACGPLGKAVFDAAQISDPEIDYNQFDSDKDGVVDFFMLVFVGCGGNGASQVQAPFCQYFGNGVPFYDNIWPHSSSLEPQYRDPATGLRGYISDDQLKSLEEVPQCWTNASRLQSTDCAANGGTGLDSLPVYVRVGPYNVNPETVFQSASVISHEYGHHLGLPDFYNAGEEVYGDLNLMAADYSQHMTIFSKQELGWVVPDYLQPGQSTNVAGWDEIKSDTGAIHWQTPGGTPYTLSAANGDQNIHNGQAYGVKLPGRILIDEVPSGTHAWWSGRGNDFGCSPTGAHNLDLVLPELASVPAGTTVTLEFKSSWDIEWDWDYGFVLTSTNGADYTSQVSANGYTTDNAYNPNDIGCQADLNNGITGTSGAWQEGEPIVTAARTPNFNDYSHGAPFLADSYDISELAGEQNAIVRFSYNTDGAFDRPGWFIDDIVVKAGGTTIYSSDFETDAEADRLFPGGCSADGFKVAAKCTDGWSWITAGAAQAADHAYYLELRDQSGFDFDGHGQSDRGDTAWQPGLFLEYTDEAHGYGNNGTPAPPAQHYLDSNPIPGSDCVDEQNGNCTDVSFTDAAGDRHFSDAKTPSQPGGFINSFSDPNSSYGDERWHFDYGCLTLDVTAMSGQTAGPETPKAGDISANATISADAGCAQFTYGGASGGPANQSPVADAQARPTTAAAGDPITFDASGSTDDRQAPGELTYAWDLDDNGTFETPGQVVTTSFPIAGTYRATVLVTDSGGLSDTASVTVTIEGVDPCPPFSPTGSYSTDFESSSDDWTVNTAANAVPASLTWAVRADAALAHSPTNSFHSDATTLDLKDDRLVSPEVDLSTQGRLTFWHRFGFESPFDGGVLEVNTGTGWVDVLAGGGSFAEGGYNGVISTEYGSPIAGRSAWTGPVEGALNPMTRVVVNLGAFAGNDVKVRFRLAADPITLPGSLPGAGWWIDDVSFSKLSEPSTCANNAPVAADDSASTTQDTPVTINVLGNDADPDGDGISVTAVGAPAHGTAVENGDGTITYTPAAGYAGPDGFTYDIGDGRGGNDTATVSITVTSAGNRPPVAGDDTATTQEDESVFVNVLDNDMDPDGDDLMVSDFSDPGNGSVAVDANGLRYTPDAGFVGSDTFTYDVTDGRDGFDTAMVTVTVTEAPNRDPDAVDDQATTIRDVAVRINVVINDSDPDGDELSVTNPTDPAHGTTVNNGDGTITYTPDAGFTGTDTFEYTLSDGSGGSDTATVAVFVNAPSSTGKATGGGSISSGGMTSTFSLNAQVKKNVVNGKLDYGTATGSIELKGSVQSLRISGPSAGSPSATGFVADMSGSCTLANGARCSYTVHLEDRAEPGTGWDVFSIRVFNAAGVLIHEASGVLVSGNIQVH